MTMSVTPALRRPRLRAATAVRMYCLPFAGGTANAYWPWLDHLPAGWELVSVQLAGRHDRLAEPVCTDLPALTADLARQIDADRTGDPYVLFGHSMGAMLAYEIARHAQLTGMEAPRVLAVSGRSAPGTANRPGTIASTMNDDELVEAMLALGGLPRELLAEPELLALLLPAVRGDLRLDESAEPIRAPRLRCPLAVLGGTEDAMVTVDDLGAWHTATSGPVVTATLPGDHFYLWQHGDSLLRTVAAQARP